MVKPSVAEEGVLVTYACSRWILLAIRFVLVFLVLLASTMSNAQTQTPEIQLGATYECPNAISFKVFSCAGPANTDLCDVEATVRGQPPQRGKSTRQQVMMLVPLCHLQTPAEAQAAKSGAGALANQQADANGFKIGETVNVATAGGWYAARILRANGDSYLVRLGPSLEVWKSYPTEMRRIGPLTDVDKARGLFALHEKVQVNVEGRWTEGEIITEMGMEYQVQLPGNLSVWATAQHLRHVAVQEKPAPQAGLPPKPGLKSCAGKIEGRYASSMGGAGSFQITFRSGKATLTQMGGTEEFECWMEREKIYLHKSGESTENDMPIDINNDGTLETPFGEMKKKGN
jgi:hypothetical protein